MNLLIVEDDLRVADFLVRGLKAEGYGVTHAQNGKRGFELGVNIAINSNQQACKRFDLIILDLMLPDMPGLDVCQELRCRGVTTPILILSAMDTQSDKIDGLRMGADDYLTKPFDFDELLARIEALLRRSNFNASNLEQSSTELKVGELVFNRDSLKVERAGKPIELTAKELSLLELLMNTPGKVYSRQRIINSVWGYSEDPMTNIVDVYISRLRNKIDDGFESPLLQTVRGRGYRLCEK